MSLKSRIEKLEGNAGHTNLKAKLANFEGDYGQFTDKELEEIIGIKNPSDEQLATIIKESSNL